MRVLLQTPVWRSCLFLLAVGILGQSATAYGKETAAKLSAADREFLETVESRTFAFYWDVTNADNGLVPDRWPNTRSATIAAVGFGLTAYCIGAERGYVSRDQAVERVLTTLRFFWNAPQNDGPTKVTGYRGFFYHFLDIQSGERYRNVELSSIDTALVMGGVLACREYFDRDDAREQEVRKLADALYRRVEWSWMQPRAPLIGMGWTPEDGFIKHDYRGYNEAMLLYLLALGSPTHPIEASAWDAYTSTYQWADFYGQEHVNFTPLFGHQFSHAWIDFRGIQDRYMRDKGIDYFENSRRATYAQRAYAIANPSGWQDYSADIWGLSAGSGPDNDVLPYKGEERQFRSYWPRGASARGIRDDGTISPAAAAGSIPFAPEITIPALQAMRSRYGDKLFVKYGFLDGFNPSFTYRNVSLSHGKVVDGLGWFETDHLGLDQGPIIVMVANYRSELIWNLMKKNPYLKHGLRRAGFSGGWLDEQL